MSLNIFLSVVNNNRAILLKLLAKKVFFYGTLPLHK